MAETLDILRGARALLANEDHWIHHGPAAVDAEGEPTGGRSHDGDEYDGDEGDALHPDSCAWCLVGACQKVAGRYVRFDDPELEPLRTALADTADESFYLKGFGLSVGMWNDASERTHGEVLAALDRAIALASRDSQQTGDPS